MLRKYKNIKKDYYKYVTQIFELAQNNVNDVMKQYT